MNLICLLNSLPSVCLTDQALNQLFEKIMALDIDERHLLRLGHGEEELETEKDFSR
jgi:intron-binding protein aquarius